MSKSSDKENKPVLKKFDSTDVLYMNDAWGGDVYVKEPADTKDKNEVKGIIQSGPKRGQTVTTFKN